MDSQLGVCIYYVLLLSVIYYPAQGKYYSFGTFLDFNNALEICQKNGSHLPHIVLENNSLLLKDFVSGGNCFWVQATLYIATDILRKVLPYPEFCCGTLHRDVQNLTHACSACSKNASFICVADLTGDKARSNISASTWTAARGDCETRGGLPFANNTNFRTKLLSWTDGIRPFWIAEIGLFRSIPEMDEEHECGYWCRNETTFGSCIQERRNLTTYCVSESNTASSDTNGRYSSDSSTINVNITRANVPARRTSERGIWPILGGIIGSFVAFIGSVIVIVIFVRRRRMKNGYDAGLNSTTNNASENKSPSEKDLSYDTVNGERFGMEAPIAKLTEASTTQVGESVTYSQPQKDNKMCQNLMVGKTNTAQATDDQEKQGLYSKIRKGEKTRCISSNLIESGNRESAENMYNTANLHQEQTLDTYDKADFRLKVVELGTSNEYDQATFHRTENANYDRTFITNVTFDSTYDHLK